MAAVFVQDITAKPLLYGITIRSGISKGKLHGFELPKLGNAYTFVSAKDIPGKNELEDLETGFCSVPVLAEREISYAGQPLALLFGPDEARLREYAGEIKVQEEAEEAQFGFQPGKLCIEERDFRSGEPEKALNTAKNFINGIYKTGIQEHWYAESSGALALYKHQRVEGEEKKPFLVVYTATQWPFHVRASVSRVLGLEKERVTVESTLIDIHLDGKIWYPSLIACHAALGSWFTKKPVKLILSRESDFCFSPKRFASEISIRSGLNERGEVLGTEIEVKADLGAHGVFSRELIDRCSLGSFGSYNFANTALRAGAQITNIAPQGPCGGFGMAQGFFAMERHVSRIADSLRQDPAEWRKKYALTKNSSLAIGTSLKEEIPLTRLIDAVAAGSGYYRKWASYELLRQKRRESGWKDLEYSEEKLRGIGIATAYQGSGFLYHGKDRGDYAVEVTLDKDGFLEIRTSMAGSNDDFAHAWGVMASEILSIDPSRVRINAVNTAVSPDSGPASLSRNILVLSRLVERCCSSIRKQRFRDPLPITVRRSIKPAKIPSWGNGPHIDSNALARLSWGAAVVEVEVDILEYIPRIRGIWLLIDGGRILSEHRALLSLKTQVLQAIGWASCEKLDYTDGKIPPECFVEYEMPKPQDIPPINIDFMAGDTSGPKGIGEIPGCCIPAAFVQAVSQAMDHSFEKIPLTPGDLRNTFKMKTGEEKQ
ncbi:MAG: xanthine dehydrogenase family protein molybdopterin-binding subunit [Treponema sp.]|jgi:CO/xanthine dehydrogenase Mo-binding subunit|nr:xanthine dehydrogenase family protein molybdopterin-binding subunit [Treponema sp.]